MTIICCRESRPCGLFFSESDFHRFGGYLTNSIAIMADAIHDLGDSLALGIAWWFEGDGPAHGTTSGLATVTGEFR